MRSIWVVVLLLLAGCPRKAIATRDAGSASSPAGVDAGSPLQTTYRVTTTLFRELAFTPDGKSLVIAAGSDCSVDLVPLEKPSTTIPLLAPCAMPQRYGLALRTVGSQVVVWTPGTRDLVVVDPAAPGSPQRRLTPHPGSVDEACFATDLSIGASLGLDGHNKNELAVWSGLDGKRIATLPLAGTGNTLSMDDTATFLATVRPEGVKLFDARTLKPRALAGRWEEAVFQPGTGTLFLKHCAQPDRQAETMLISAVDPRTGQSLRQYHLEGRCDALRFSADGTHLYLRGQGLSELVLADGAVRKVGEISALSPDGRFVIGPRGDDDVLRSGVEGAVLREIPKVLHPSETFDWRALAGRYEGKGRFDGQIGETCQVTLDLAVGTGELKGTLKTELRRAGEGDFLETRTYALAAGTVVALGELGPRFAQVRARATPEYAPDAGRDFTANFSFPTPDKLFLGGWEERACLPVNATRVK